MMIRSLLGVSALALGLALAGCAASSADIDDEPSMGREDALTGASQERAAQIGAVRARVMLDFANVASLRGYKLVFVVKGIQGDGSKAAFRGQIMKRNAAGTDFELSDDDYVGSAFEDAIAEGLFDGPEVTAGLQKMDGKWSVIKKGSGDEALEAYVVGPTDLAYVGWDQEFGLKRSWLGL